MPFNIFNIFKNNRNNKVSPAPSPSSSPVGSVSTPGVKSGGESDSSTISITELTPRQRESHDGSIKLPELKRNNFIPAEPLTENEKVKSFIIIPEKQTPLSGEEYTRIMEKEGVPTRHFYDFEREAFYAGRKAFPNQSFSVHEIEYIPGNMQIKDIAGNELAYLNAEQTWLSGKSFKPEDEFDSGVENNLRHTHYYFLPIAFADIEKLVPYDSNKKTLDPLPTLFNTAEDAFKNGRKNYPGYTLSVIRVETPMKSLDQLKAKYRDPLKYLISRSKAVIEFSAKDKKFNDGKKVWELRGRNPEPKDFPKLKK